MGVPRPKLHPNHSQPRRQVTIRDVVWFTSPRGAVWPLLKPAVCRVKRANKLLPKAQDCYYVGPGVNHPRDCMRVLTTNRSILTTRNVTWRHVPLPPPRAPAATALYCRRRGVCSGGGRERGGSAKSRRREGGRRCGRRVRP